MAFATFVAGAVLTAAQVNDYLMKQTVIVCTSATRPTGVEGMVIYETDTDRIYIWTGAAWSALFNPAHGTWQTATPTWTNLTVGNGTSTQRYTVVGRMCTVHTLLTWGSTTSISGTVTCSIPIAGDTNNEADNASATLYDATGSRWFGRCYRASASTVGLLAMITSGSHSSSDLISATVPFTWATNDYISFSYSYEID